MKKILYQVFFPGLIWLTFSCSGDKAKTTEIKNGALVELENLQVKVQFYADDEIRVTKWIPESSDKKTSLSVIKEMPNVNVTIENVADAVHISSGSLKAVIFKKTGSVSFFTPDGKRLLAEGSSSFEPVTYSGDKGYAMVQNFELTKTEGIYGLGQHQYGYMNYRGKEVKLVQSNTDAVNSFLVSTLGYGILWDNYSMTILKDDGNTNASIYSDMGDNIDYYFVGGESIDDAIAGYRDLTGQAPMYGKYAYGYWQSKEHYKTQDEVLAIASKYRRLKIPIDNMIQDWNYWEGNANWSSMVFDKTRYPDPKGMVDKLHAMNFHAIISIWPAIGPASEFYRDMDKHGFLYEPVGWAGFKYYDAFNPEANKLYWQYLKKGIYSTGMDGWWIDSTEPDVVNALTKDAEEHEMKKVGSTHIGSWARYLNAFSLVMTDAIHKYWREETSDRRAYILTRSTFAGQQRNGATTWSGDIGANWEVYKHQIAAGVNHCMSGIPYWTFDIGAFVIGAYDGVFMEGGKDPAYQELYTRMFQFGAFCPIFRSHGSETPREIWEFDQFTPTLVKYDNLRYRLMPYIYSLAWKVTSDSYTLMRGLPMDFASDTKTYDIDDQFLFGPAFMPCPVVDFMYHTPPKHSVMIGGENYRTNDGQEGLVARYYKDHEYKVFGREQVDTTIDVFWYTGRPDYVSDSAFAIRWEGKLIPTETGKHQFHLKSFDAKRIFLNGKQLKMVYTSTEQYSEKIELAAGKEYDFVLETENTSTGAARMQLFWKTPSIFESEKQVVTKDKIREVYLPEGTSWYDFWTGERLKGGETITAAAPIDIMPLYVKAGSIVPMGPFLQYSTEKPADPIELRIYPGADGTFTLYEDENDNYNYEKGMYLTIGFSWNDKDKTLTIAEQQGREFPGMLKKRTFRIVLVDESHGTGAEICPIPDETVVYEGKELTVKL
ncbi:MAG: DUF5110 domain-containing protein [Bacteroidales bacterium]|nr:DUF5110 domain-containing protein [Bacteroidales bacterium]